MVVDVRLPGGGHSAPVTHVGQVFDLELWATLTGDDATGDNESLISVFGGLSSTNINDGAVRGGLFVDLTESFSAPASADSNHPLSHVVMLPAATVDIDADGDLDVGMNQLCGSLNGILYARRQPYHADPGIVDGRSRHYHLGNVRFTVTSLAADDYTTIVFRPLPPTGLVHWTGAWKLDDTVHRSVLIKPFVLHRPSAPPLELAPQEGVRLPTPDCAPNDPPAPPPGDPPPGPIPPPPVDPPPDPPEPDIAPPAVTALFAAPEPLTYLPYTFAVRYADNREVQPWSFGSRDILITRHDGKKIFAEYAFTHRYSDSRSITATYRLKGSGRNGAFAYQDNGTYSIQLNAGEVTDRAGNTVPSRDLGTFVIDVPPAKLEGASLSILGSDQNDTIRIFAQRGQITVERNGVTFPFASGGVRKIRVDGLGGNDVITASGKLKPLTFYGGDGNDTLLGSAAGDALFGDAGDDWLDGAGGGDQLRGGDGRDTVDYSSRRRGVVVTLDGRANDGNSGERDNVAADVEVIRGGRGNDRLIGNAHANMLIGSKGRDTLIGGGGEDSLLGGAGKDVLG